MLLDLNIWRAPHGDKDSDDQTFWKVRFLSWSHDRVECTNIRYLSVYRCLWEQKETNENDKKGTKEKQIQHTHACVRACMCAGGVGSCILSLIH
jgi:hypothetical protein